MKKTLSVLTAAIAVVSAGLMAPAPAAAQSFTAAGQGAACDPQKTNTSGAYTKTSANAFGTVACTSSGTTVSLSAWGFLASTTATSNTLTGLANNAAVATGAVQGNLGDFNGNGFGAYTGSKEASANYGEHAFDNYGTTCSTATDATNYSGATTAGGGTSAIAASTSANGCGGAVEALLMNFNSKVSLTQLTSGYQGADGDFSIYVWTGSSTAPTSLAGQTLTNNATSGLTGWTLVQSGDFGGSVADGTGVNPFNVANGGSLYSSAFLITTYFGASTTTLNYGNDAFKLNGWTVKTCATTVTGGNGGNGGTCSTQPSNPAPEPMSLALFGIAALGAGAARRRAKALRA